jgi:hypothetical protein
MPSLVPDQREGGSADSEPDSDSESDSESEPESESAPESALTPEEVQQLLTLTREINSLSQGLASKKIN